MQHSTRMRVGLQCLGVLLSLLHLGVPFAYAQRTSDYQVKAAYLYNFAKFVEWPAANFATPESPIQLCVLNDRLFEAELNRIVIDKSVAGRRVAVVAVQGAQESRGCQMLFINSAQGAQARRIIQLLQRTSVVTVGESTGFVEEGGIINFVLQDQHVQFEVNHKAANQAGLRISSRLLSVAKLVIE
jgi:hypothetical protein